MLNPDMPTQQLRLHMGELTAQEVRVARAAIRWANFAAHDDLQKQIVQGARRRMPSIETLREMGVIDDEAT